MEAHALPLAHDSLFTPLRGRFCLDNSCTRMGDEDDYTYVVIRFRFGLVSLSSIFPRYPP